MQYLKGTTKLKLRIEPDDHPNMWVYSLYAVHPEMKIHSDIYMSVCKGVTKSAYYIQKLNTKGLSL